MLLSADMGTRQDNARAERQRQAAANLARFRALGGLRLPVKQAAREMGVTERCIIRWRARLREQEAGQ